MSIRDLTSDNITILVFPPGCGGNHLANLLSLHDKFQQRFISNNYFEDLYKKYKFKEKNTINHHFGILENLREVDWDNAYSYFKTKTGIPVICSHAVEYYNFLSNNNKDVFNSWLSRNIILFTFPSLDTLAYKRFYQLRQGEGIDAPNLNRKYIIEDYKEFYTKKGFDEVLKSQFSQLNSICKSELENITCLDTDKFVTENGFDYIQYFFKEEFGIELPNFGKMIHEIWYQNLTN